MPSRLLLCLINAVIFSWAIAIPASGGDWPFARRKAAPEQPNSMVQIARSLDAVEEKIRDDGIVVIKQPDVWGQARMTKYRVDFEKSIMENLKFEETLSAVISRADRAALESQTAFGVSLTPGAKAAGGVQVTNNSSDDTGKGQAALVTAAQDLINKAKDKDGLNEFEKTETFKLMKDASTLFKAKDSPVVGLEPTVLLEEKKTFYDRLNQYRRQNMGDDSGDSAGYNLYQFGMPVSIQPGDKTHRDHGAQLTISIHHEFGPDFLATTYRTLVINDLVDRLTPLVYETIRDKDFVKAYEEAYGKEGRLRRRKKREEVEEKIAGLNRSIAELDRQVSEATSKLRSLYAQVPKEVFRVPITKLESPEQTKLVEEFGTSEGKKTYYAAQTNMASEVTFEAPPAPPPQNDPASPEWVDYRKKLDRYADLNRYETRVPTTPPSPPESYLNRISQAYRQTEQKNRRAYLEEGRNLTTSIGDTALEKKDLENQINNLLSQRNSLENELYALGRSEFEVLSSFPSSRVQDEEYPIAPSDLLDVLIEENFWVLAEYSYGARQTLKPRAADVRAFLSHELSAAYDLLAGNCRGETPKLADVEFLSKLAEVIQSRQYNELEQIYNHNILPLLPDFEDRGRAKAGKSMYLDDFRARKRSNPAAIPGEGGDANRLVDEISAMKLERRVGPLCWAIAVDAALLNCRFRQELREFNGVNGFRLTCDPDSLIFHLPMPREPGGDPTYATAQEVFKEFVIARWPVVCFSLDPINDQQNIADAFSRTRDLQVALAMAFSAGKLGFNQLLRYRRQLDYEAATIALNRTVSCFVTGNETFGWRFAPRFQTPPEEKSNFHVIANQVIRGGPGRDYQVKNSKMEAGQRELSAVVIMPSILQRVRMDITGNWYRLSDPDEITLHTAHMLEQGRRVIELRQALASACDSGQYRPDDLSRMMIKVDQLEAMLPMQTKSVIVPYGNNLGGFDLFKRGSSSLAPFLSGYQGVDELTSEGCRNAFLIFGKNISIQETKVVAGGQRMDQDDVEILSREVMRVRLPKNLEITTTQDGEKYVELHLGTPNGISNRLLLPFNDKLVTTTTITDIKTDQTDNTNSNTWKRSVETKVVTGPRPKCDLDNPAAKTGETKPAAGPDHSGSGGGGGGAPSPGQGGDGKPSTDKEGKKPAEDPPFDKKAAAKPETSPPSPHGGGEKAPADVAPPPEGSSSPLKHPTTESPGGMSSAAPTKPTMNQTIVVSRPPAEEPATRGRHLDEKVKRASASPKRRTIMDRLMNRGPN